MRAEKKNIGAPTPCIGIVWPARSLPQQGKILSQSNGPLCIADAVLNCYTM